MDSLYYSIVEDDLGLDSTIETELLKALRSENRQALNSKFLLSSRDQQGELIGGLSASTSYGWVLIELVWVSEEARGAGIGSALIRAAERKARSLNCHAAWLETSNASARRLYSTLGYEAFGELHNNPGQFPDEHHRWFMKKTL